jgi:hypothetical protein
VQDVLHSAQVMVLATVTPAELRKIGPWGLPSDELAFEALMDRGTALDDFVDAIARASRRYRSQRPISHSWRICTSPTRAVFCGLCRDPPDTSRGRSPAANRFD